jgi:predicted transcriptional regulator
MSQSNIASIDDGAGAQSDELLRFFKALADANRLRIVAILARGELSVEQLAGRLGLSSSTVSHHLSRLSRIGLVSARAEGYYSIYRLESGAISDMAKRLLREETLPAVAAGAEVDSFDRKVLRTYLGADGRIRAFPAQQKKELAILRHVVAVFEPDRRYSEKQVNRLLRQFSDDTARLRRHLVDFGFMDREGGGGDYWRTDQADSRTRPQASGRPARS